MTVVNYLVRVAPGQLLGCVAQRARSSLVDEGYTTIQIETEDAVAHCLEYQFALPCGQV